MPPTEAGSSLGCSGCRPAAAAQPPPPESLQSLPLSSAPRPAGDQEPDDVWGAESGSCALGATSRGKHVVVQLWLPPSSTGSFPRPPATQPKQPHPRQSRLILANCPRRANPRRGPLLDSLLAAESRRQKEMLLGTQFASDQLAVSEQCGQTSQHAATHPKVNIESQGLESTAARLSIV